jgi:hypothetical protein
LTILKEKRKKRKNERSRLITTGIDIKEVE